jgi:hypothetical protein
VLSARLASLALPKKMITLLVRRLLNGYYFRKMRHGTQYVAWQAHTHALNAKIARKRERLIEEAAESQPVRTSNPRASVKKSSASEVPGAKNTKVIGQGGAPGVERKVKTR